MIRFGIISRVCPGTVYDVQFGFGPLTDGKRPKSFIPWQSEREDVLAIIEKHGDLVRRAIATNTPMTTIPSGVVTIAVSDEERHALGGGFRYGEVVRAKLMEAGGDPDSISCRRDTAGRREVFTTKRKK